jgi:hypothetical protein
MACGAIDGVNILLRLPWSVAVEAHSNNPIQKADLTLEIEILIGL